MRLVQFVTIQGERAVAVVEEPNLRIIGKVTSLYDVAQAAIAAGEKLECLVIRYLSERRENYDRVILEKRLLSPINHPNPAHCLVSGTGLTHLGSANARDTMHQGVIAIESETVTDSMKMFQMGIEGGKPRNGQAGVQPEWFFKGDGSWIVPPEQSLPMPDFAADAGEEPEIAGIYVIGPGGEPRRLGFSLGNEFSDHAIERANYLWLAHSKLRCCSLGPELLLGDLPDDIRGISRINRNGKAIWEREFLSGERNMSHSIANLEHHHFKYRRFRRSGDVHVHFFGTATLSFADNFRTEIGDVFEISVPEFGRPLRNHLSYVKAHKVDVVAL